MLTTEALKEIYTALGGDADAEFSLNVEGLKAIFTALGGDPAEVADLDDIASVCSKIATVAKGGGGDFTTAKMTFINNSSSAITDFVYAHTTEEYNTDPYTPDGHYPLMLTGPNGSVLGAGTTEVYDVVLYKGKSLLGFPYTSPQIALSGSIELSPISSRYYVISGDCTVTFS